MIGGTDPGHAELLSDLPGDTNHLPANVISSKGEWDIEILPTLDNRWGDFESPPSDEKLGPVTRRFRYREEWSEVDNDRPRRADSDDADPDNADLEDSDFLDVTRSFGPRYWVLGPVPPSAARDAFETSLIATRELPSPGSANAVEIGGRSYEWFLLGYSDRWGIEAEPLLTSRSGISIHGPIGWVPDDQIHLESDEASPGDSWYLASTLFCPGEGSFSVAAGSGAPYALWIDGERTLIGDGGGGIEREGIPLRPSMKARSNTASNSPIPWIPPFQEDRLNS